MNPRDGQPVGLLEIGAVDLQPGDLQLVDGHLLAVQAIEPLQLGAPDDAWRALDPDGGKRLDVIYGERHRCILRYGDAVLIAVPVQRA